MLEKLSLYSEMVTCGKKNTMSCLPSQKCSLVNEWVHDCLVSCAEELPGPSTLLSIISLHCGSYILAAGHGQMITEEWTCLLYVQL